MENSQKTFVEKSLIVLGLVVLAMIVLAAVYYTFDVILLIFSAVLIAIFLRGLSEIIGRYVKISEGKLVLLTSAVLLVLIAGAIALLSPSVAEQVRHLRQEVPASAEKSAEFIKQFAIGRTIIEQMPTTDEVISAITNSNFLSSVGGIFSTTLGGIGNFFIVILLAVYLAAEPRFYTQGFTKLFPLGARARVEEILGAVGETLRWWLIGKVGSMLFIGLLTWIGLSILGVPLALTLGILAGLLSFIPNFGPIISAVPAVMLAFIESPITAAYVVGLFILVQLIESNIVTPIIERETVELPPALTIVFQLALAVIVGGLGLVLATPLLAMVMVIVQMAYIQDVLGDRNVEVEEKEIVDEGTSRLIDDDEGEPR